MRLSMDVNGTGVKRFLSRTLLPDDGKPGVKDYNIMHSDRFASTIRVLSRLSLKKESHILELAAEPYGMTACLAPRFANISIATFSDPPTERSIEIKVRNRSYYLTEHGFNLEFDAWPFEKATFDLVMACEILEHLPMDPMALFAGANRVLKPGGLLLISTPNAASIQNIIKLGKMVPAGLAQHFRRPPDLARLYERHNREYNPFAVGDMMLAAGLEVVIMETDSSFPLFDLGFSKNQIDQMLELIGTPELRCDTVYVVGRKTGDVVNRFPETQDLYVAADDNAQSTSGSPAAWRA